jgi:hypothetical protein
MGVLNAFTRVDATKLLDEVLPAFERASREGAIASLLPYLDLERLRAETGSAPSVELRARGLFKKRKVARFIPSPGVLLDAILPKLARDDGYDADKLLYGFRQRTELLSDGDWEQWDELLEWAHNLPEMFYEGEGPYGFISPQEIPMFVELLRRLATRLPKDEYGERAREDVDRLCGYLQGTAPSDGVLVYTG